MNAIKEIEKFATDRAIDKMKHDATNYATNIIEELLELHGYDVPKENRSDLKAKFEAFIDNVETDGIAIKNKTAPSPHDVIDTIADITVFSVTELQKLNMCTETVLKETAKEINSRTGSLVDGKFEKDLSDEAKKNWYKANYMKAHVPLIEWLNEFRANNGYKDGTYIKNWKLSQNGEKLEDNDILAYLIGNHGIDMAKTIFELRYNEMIDRELNLCDTCKKDFATCTDVCTFGYGNGNDNVIKCDGYEKQKV